MNTRTPPLQPRACPVPLFGETQAPSTAAQVPPVLDALPLTCLLVHRVTASRQEFVGATGNEEAAQHMAVLHARRPLSFDARRAQAGKRTWYTLTLSAAAPDEAGLVWLLTVETRTQLRELLGVCGDAASAMRRACLLVHPSGRPQPLAFRQEDAGVHVSRFARRTFRVTPARVTPTRLP